MPPDAGKPEHPSRPPGRCAVQRVACAIPKMPIAAIGVSKAVAFNPPEVIGPKLARRQRADVAGRLCLRGVGLGRQHVRARSDLLALNGGGRFGDWPSKQHAVFAGLGPRNGGGTARRARGGRGLGFRALLRRWRHRGRELLDGHAAIWRPRRLDQACNRHVGLSCQRR